MKLNQENFEYLYSQFNQKMQNKEFEEALLLVPELLEIAQDNELDVFYTLMGKASALTNLNEDQDVIDTYDEIIQRFKDTKNETI